MVKVKELSYVQSIKKSCPEYLIELKNCSLKVVFKAMCVVHELPTRYI